MNPHSEKGREELDLLFTPSQVDNFQVFTNPLLSEKIKLEALQTGTTSLSSIHTPLVKTVPVNQSNPGKLSPSSQQSSSLQLTMAEPRNQMATMVAARYAPLVLLQPLNALPAGDYQKYLPRFNGQGETTAEEHWDTFCSYAENHNLEH